MPETAPPWLETMRQITGTLERPGSDDNPVILSWRDEIARRFPEMAEYCSGYTHDSIPWCGLTVAYCMAHNGVRPVFGPTDTDKFLWAYAWKGFGTPTNTPQLGDVLVFQRHVTLYEGQEGNSYLCRGGNQSDSVNVIRWQKSGCQAIRRPPAAVAIDQPMRPVVPISQSSRRFSAITATVFGGPNDANRSAYDGHIIDDDELGVALPARFRGPRPKVRVYKGSSSVECEIVDVGPWNTNDSYWETGARPQAESGVDRRGRPTNRAGIDLTPGAARAVGLSGKGIVDWEFVGALQPAPPPLPPGPPPPYVPPYQAPAMDVAQILAELEQVIAILGKRTLPPTRALAPVPPTPTPIAIPLSPIDELLGGQALVGKKTLLSVVAYVILAILQSNGFLVTDTGAAADVVKAHGEVATTASTTGQVLTTLIGAFGGLGLVAKFDRMIQALGMIAGKIPK